MKKIIGFGLLLAAIDQITKLIVANILDVNETITIIKDFFYITYLKNNGAAWNILEGNTIFLVFLGIVAIMFIIYLIKDEKVFTNINIFGYSLLFGGILGNLIDRIHTGNVVDFIYINLLDFPIFNFSDICIVLGAIIFTYDTIRSELNGKNNSKQNPKTR